MRVLLVFVCLTATLASAEVILPGKCPQFVPKTDFDVTQYLGTWREILRFDTRYENGQRCNYAEYTDNGDGTVGVHNAGYDADGTYTEIFGYVEPSDIPGALLLHLDGVPFVGDYNVLDTDYVTYAAVFSCGDVLELGHVEQAWVLARDSHLSQEDLEAALDAFTRWGIDTDQFTKTDQENCVFA